MPGPPFATTLLNGALARTDQVILQLDPGVALTGIGRALAAFGRIADQIAPGRAGDGATLVFTIVNGPPLEKLLDLLARVPGVKRVEPDYLVQTFDDVTPEDLEPVDVETREGPVVGVDPNASSNDPGYTGGSSWGMYGDLTPSRTNVFGSQAGEAWAANHTGSTSVAVGLVDTGVDYTHVDLYRNIWLNPDEIPAAFRSALTDTDGDGRITFRDLNMAANASFVSDLNANSRIDAGDLLNDSRWENGADDDDNGFVDDLIGWDFVNGDNDPYDDVGHGTHVAGVIAASGGNGVGVAGVSWHTQLVVAKMLGPTGGSSSGAVMALDYVAGVSATTNVVATNNSWGGSGLSLALQDAVNRQAEAGILFVASAGNGGPDKVGDNNDSTPSYPSNFNTTAAAGYDAVIAIAALTSTGALASFSNFGAASVDLAAPGVLIYSTLPGGAYGSMSGTSMAAPFVTGAIALYAAASPGATPADIRNALFGTATPTSGLGAVTTTGGRLDVSGMIYAATSAGLSVSGTSANDTIGVTKVSAGLTPTTVFNDTLTGSAGNDKLDGGPGADRYVGGPGTDSFVIDNAGDVVVEAANEGTDTVQAYVSYTLPANVENGLVLGLDGVNLTGNDLANTLTGNAAGNRLDGAGGNDNLKGEAGADTLIGGDGNDKLTGGTGADSMVGGAGNDTYDVDDAGDRIHEGDGEGNDLVNSPIDWVLGPQLEKLTLTGVQPTNGDGNELGNTITGNTAANRLSGLGGADTLNGGDGDDTLVGGDGADKLTGGLGADSLVGGAGNDTYEIDHVGDVISEAGGDGNDLVNSSLDFTLPDDVERLTLTGAADLDGVGNALANSLTGNSGANELRGEAGADTLTGGLGADTLIGGADNDKLTGGGGADSMVGGAGSDTYEVDDAGDVVSEQGGDGNDLVSSLISYVLPDDVERLTLTGSGLTNGTGNGLANLLTGNASANRLDGLGGGDTLSGGSGDDTLNGGAGIDRLTGGAGLDRFVFQPGEAAGDTVTDFAAGDILEFRGYGANSTLVQVAGSTIEWRITDGVTGATEIIKLSNKYLLAVGDYLFT